MRCEAMTAMDRVLLLVAGYPGTGKSHVCTLLQDRLGPLRLLALDAVKEELYDQEGFADAAAKAHLDRAALELFLARVRTAMVEGGPLLAEYPFSEKQRPALAAACAAYDYRPFTVRLVAEFEELFARQHRRDLDPSRHLGHLVDAYRPGDILTDRCGAPQVLTREVFLERFLHRGYGQFALGPVLEVDTTDFALVDDDALIEAITRRIAEERTGTPS